MASLIPGFTYDIFISYRQKDNKGDRWVSEFVEALKIEIESTFKEEVGVYFDVNPHDGLLETHDVDASLKEKLKCLVFIPILSRTYCDPKSFAWEHEFKSFVETAHQDQFGLKVNLLNGNVSNRVLPVRIHDLDATDIKLCESVLGGIIRGVDFVYREAGVNRPLTPEDEQKKNLNNIRYRNQINKTANAIREIITGLKTEPLEITNEKPRHQESWEEVSNEKPPGKPLLTIFDHVSVRWLLILLLTILSFFGAIAVYRILSLAKTNKTIAVYFSSDEKSDSTLKNIGIVYTEAIHSKLYKVKSLTLRPRFDMHQYTESENPMSTIRKDLAVNYVLYGNIRRSGNDIFIWVELTSEKVKKDLWLKTYSWNRNLVSKNSTEIVQEIVRNLNVKISSGEIEEIKTEPTKNAEANLNYTYANAISYNVWSSITMGNKYLESTSFNSAIQAYDKAIEEDPKFAQAYAKRAIARALGYYIKQLDSTHVEKCLEDINKAIKINKDLPDIQMAQGFYYYYCLRELDKALEYFSRAAKKNPEDFQPLFYMAMVYRRRGEWNECKNLINRIIALDPQDALCLTNIGLTYGYFHNYDSAMIYHQKAIEVLPVWSSSYRNKLETIIMKNGNINEARKLLDTAIQKTGEKFKDFEILLDIYEGRYSDALKESEKLHPSDLKFKGIKYLYQAGINNYLKNSKNAGIYYDSARVSFENDLKKDKNIPEIHSYLGLANAGLNNKAKAILEGNKAVDLIKYNNFDKSDMIVNLARIYTMVGEYDQAVSSVEYLLQTELNTPSDLSVNLLQLDPVWKPILNIPEIKSLLKKYSVNKK
jgi:tetratricopeptide (TPR) repeat protein